MNEPFKGFWNRLHSFVANVEVSDAMSEEEKGMILHTCKEQMKVKNLAKPDVSGQLPPMFIRWCISKKIEVYSGDAIGITSMSDNCSFPVVSAERLFEIFMEETGGNFR